MRTNQFEIRQKAFFFDNKSNEEAEFHKKPTCGSKSERFSHNQRLSHFSTGKCQVVIELLSLVFLLFQFKKCLMLDLITVIKF